MINFSNIQPIAPEITPVKITPKDTTTDNVVQPDEALRVAEQIKTEKKDEVKLEKKSKESEARIKLRESSSQTDQNLEKVDKELQSMVKQFQSKVQVKLINSSEPKLNEEILKNFNQQDVAKEGIEKQQEMERQESIEEDNASSEASNLDNEQETTQAKKSAGEKEAKKTEEEKTKSDAKISKLQEVAIEESEETTKKENEENDELTEESTVVDESKTNADEMEGTKETQKSKRKEEKSKTVNDPGLLKTGEINKGESVSNNELSKENRNNARIETDNAITEFKKTGNSAKLEKICSSILAKGINKELAGDALAYMAIEKSQKGDTKLLMQIAYNRIEIPESSKDKLLASELKKAILTGDVNIVSKLKPQAAKDIQAFHKALDGDIRELKLSYPDIAEKVEKYNSTQIK